MSLGDLYVPGQALWLLPVSLLVFGATFGLIPGLLLRVIVLFYPKDDPRRHELFGELYNPDMGRFERYVWVFQQLETALRDGLQARRDVRRRRKWGPTLQWVGTRERITAHTFSSVGAPLPVALLTVSRPAHSHRLLLISAVGVALGVGLGIRLATLDRTEFDTAAQSCPTDVAHWLPSDGGDAVLEAAFTTSRHTITLCRTASGMLFYDGQITGTPASADTHIALPAKPTPSGYAVNNGAYEYKIAGAEIVIYRGGAEISRQPLTRTWP